MKRVAIVGANGFVGSAFRRLLERKQDVELSAITRENYSDLRGQEYDILVFASANSKKFLADERPRDDFRLSVEHRLEVLLDFPSKVHLHVSSVDVYDRLDSTNTTREDTTIERRKQSLYGFHKLLAEDLVERYAEEWLTVRLAGMVGPGLRKNPIFDILNGLPLHVNAGSQYQFMTTDDVATLTWELLERGVRGEAVNLCGDGLISPREIAALANRSITETPTAMRQGRRIVDINIDRAKSLFTMPSTHSAVMGFIRSVSDPCSQASGEVS